MKSKNLLFIIPIVLSTLFTSPVKAQPDSCRVLNRSYRSAKILASPNGEEINALRNGRVVDILEYDRDYRGRPWAYVSGWYNGEYRYWGWIRMDYLKCY
jgi:hypothetical protein